jgi:hypothetical protein
MSNNSINNNSKRYCYEKSKCYTFQSYNRINLGEEIKICFPKNQNANTYSFQNNSYIMKQQQIYTLMRNKPELFPIISSVQNMNLSPNHKRMYSNLWYKQFGTSQALPVNDNWGGFYVVGSDVPYTN